MENKEDLIIKIGEKTFKIKEQEIENLDPKEEKEEKEDIVLSNIDDFSQFSEKEPAISSPKENYFNEPPPSYPAQPINESKPKENFIFLKIIIGILAFFILGGIGTATILAARIWDPLWNPFRPNPEKIIINMIEKMKTVKTIYSEANTEIILKNKDEYKIEGKIKSIVDNNEPENIKTANDIYINLSTEGMIYSIGFETKQIGETTYFKLTTIPMGPLFSEIFQQLGIDLNDFKKNWIRLSPESFIEIFKDFLKESEYKKLIEKQKEQLTKQKEAQEKIKKIIIENKELFLIKKELPDEKIGNKKFYHYVVILNQEEIKKIINEILPIILESSFSYSFDSQEEFKKELKVAEEELSKKLNKFFEKKEEIVADLFIEKKDNYLHRIKMEETIDFSTLGIKEKGTFFLSLDINFSKFNEQITIEEPKDYLKMEEIFLGFVKNYFEKLLESQEQMQRAAIYSYLNHIRNIAELIYLKHGSYKSLCANNNLNINNHFFGKDLNDLKIHLDQMQRGSLQLKCYSSTQSFCIETNFSYPNKAKICFDSSGNFKQIADNFKCIGAGTEKNPFRCPVGSVPNFQEVPQKKDQGIITYLQNLQSSLLTNLKNLFEK